MTTEEKKAIRIKMYGEIFTPPSLVSEMLDKLPSSCFNRNITFCDPACGNGNMIVPVLYEKLKRGHNPLEALKTIYGVDIMKNSIKECRRRLLKTVSNFETVTEEHVKTVFINIRLVNINKHPGGSLDYDFSFTKNKHKQSDIDRWMDWIKNCNFLDNLDLPVEETEDGFGTQKRLEF